MSHFSTLRSKITDAELLKVSLRDLGFTVETNAEVRGMGCQRVHADIVAVLDGSYDIVGFTMKMEHTASWRICGVSRESITLQN